ncbi:uncharacterized protein AB675_3343 [Cyphellophora attinorum]|uniref:DUF1772 domain-containing protein n=1 Tax=Cyphellophora attinorum TaxID=1664694 RepID=A0A0N1H415_9EURO|nr:uncharacterized protein AB675_3343 [Phialophora attinorum]KPI39826.1 hypothetical protein AB675_3343 [Phialophora attinorum]
MLLAGLLTPACALALYEATLSYRAIVRLRTYESASETAAQYSQMAADKLWRTRTTQGAAAVSILLSIGTSLYTLFLGGSSAVLNTVTAVSAVAAWFHFSPFWQEQVTIPGVYTWNEAVEASNTLRPMLLGQAGLWLMISLLSFFV